MPPWLLPSMGRRAPLLRLHLHPLATSGCRLQAEGYGCMIKAVGFLAIWPTLHLSNDEVLTPSMHRPCAGICWASRPSHIKFMSAITISAQPIRARALAQQC
eukprot:8168004-Pyramimonas_sp.AAC.1